MKKEYKDVYKYTAQEWVVYGNEGVDDPWAPLKYPNKKDELTIKEAETLALLAAEVCELRREVNNLRKENEAYAEESRILRLNQEVILEEKLDYYIKQARVGIRKEVGEVLDEARSLASTLKEWVGGLREIYSRVGVSEKRVSRRIKK